MHSHSDPSPKDTIATCTLGPPEAPCVLLLHGNCAPPDALRPLAEQLAARWHVLLPDMPGYGDSPPVPHADLELAEQRLLHMLQQAEISRLAIVGLSFGAWRAFSLALHHDQALDVCGIVGLGAIAGVEPHQQRAMHGLADALQRGKDMSGSAANHWGSTRFLKRHPDFQQTVRRWLDQAPDEVMAQETEAVAECEDLRPLLSTLQLPVYLRVGSEDHATPPERVRALSKLLPHARLDVVPHAGHMLVQEDLVGTHQAIDAFLERVLA